MIVQLTEKEIAKIRMVLEDYDVVRQHAHDKSGAKTPDDMKDDDDRIERTAEHTNSKSKETQYNADAYKNFKSAVTIANDLAQYIENEYDFDIWDYDDGYSDRQADDTDVPDDEKNEMPQSFDCGEDRGEKWAAHFEIGPERVMIDTSKDYYLKHKNFGKYTGKFVINAYADVIDSRIIDNAVISTVEEAYEFADKLLSKASELWIGYVKKGKH